MPNALQIAGSQNVKPNRYAPIWTNRFFTGLWTQRNPLRDAATPYLFEKFYAGSRFESLIDGANVELSNKLTIRRRPGTSVYNSQSFDPINTFYEFKRFTTQGEQILVMADTDAALFEATGPSNKNLLLNKTGVLELTSASLVPQGLTGLGNAIIADGVSVIPVGSTVTIVGNSVDVLNGTHVIVNSGAGFAQWHQATDSVLNGTGGTITNGTSNVAGQSYMQSVGNTLCIGDGVDTKKWVTSKYSWMAGINFSAGTFIVDTNNNIQVALTTGTSGATQPTTWGKTAGSLTTDGGITWQFRGPAVQNWGIATPTSTPTVTPNHAGFAITPSYVTAITNITESSTTATVTTSANHNVQVGQFVQISGNSVSGYNNTGVGWLVLTTPTPTTFTFTAGSGGLGTGTGGTCSLFGYYTPGNAAQNTIIVNTLNVYSGLNQNQPVFFAGATPLASATNPIVSSLAGTRALFIAFSNVLLITGAGGGTIYGNDGTGTLTTLIGRSLSFSYKNNVTGHISTASQSVSITAVGTNSLQVTGPKSNDPNVDGVIVWATEDGGSTFFNALEIPPSVYIPAVSNWTGVVSLPDNSFNIFQSAPINDANDPPPFGLINLTYHLGRVWGTVGNFVYYSGTNPQTVGVGAESFPPLNSFWFPDSVSRLVPISNGLLVFTVSDVYAIIGTTTLISVPFLQGIGLRSYNALTINGSTIYLNTADGQVIELNPSSGVSEVGFPVGDLLEQIDSSKSYLTWHVDGSQDKALYVGDGVNGWYRMNPTSAPETGLSWSPFADIVGGTSAIQSVEVLPGKRELLIGPSFVGGQILKRDLLASDDNSNTYGAYATIGSIVLAQPGQVADVEFITTDCTANGSHVSVGVLLDEITGNFETLASSTPDPPQLPPSQSTYADRWYLVQKGTYAQCRHMQVKFSWPAESAVNELLSYTVFGSQTQEK